MKKKNPLQKFDQTYARSEANTVLIDDEVITILKLLTSGFSGLLLVVSAAVLANADKFSKFGKWSKVFIIAYCALLVFDIAFLGLATLQSIISRGLHRRMVAHDLAGTEKPKALIAAFDLDQGALGNNCARSLILSAICMVLLPVLVGISLF